MASHPLSILVLSDLADADQGDAVLLSRTDGTVVGTDAVLPNGGCGDVLPSGIFAFGEQQVVGSKLAAVAIYTSGRTLITRETTIAAANPLRWQCPLIAWGTSTFYFLAQKIADATHPTLYTISSAGVIGGTTWAIDTSAIGAARATAVNLAGTIFYWSAANQGDAIHRYDLVNSMALTNLVAGAVTNFVGTNFYITPDDDLVVPYQTTAGTNWLLQRYSSAGVLQDSFDIGPNLWGDEPELFTDVDPANVWVRTFPDVDGFQSRFRLYVIATGATIYDWTVTTLAGGGDVPVTCPVLQLRTTSSTTTFTIRRQRRFLLPSSPDNKRMSISRLELLLRTGIGLLPDAVGSSTPLGVDPEIRMRISNTGGKTWGAERTQSGGLRGEYKDRAYWLQATGQYRNGVCEITVDAPVDWQPLAMIGDPTEGSS